MKYPKDRFDDFPRGLNRRGAHRAPRTRLSKLGSWLIALAAIVVLVSLGVGVMWMIDRQVQFTEASGQTEPTPTESAQPAPSPEPEPEPTAVFDGEIPVDVLNGAGAAGLATAGGERLGAAGWQVDRIDDADTTDHTATRIAVTNAEQLPIAMGVAEALGFGEAVVDPELGETGRIVVVLGADAVEQLL